MISSKTTQLCPVCGIGAKGIKAIRELFGTRCEGRTPVPQSYCRKCRSEHARQRRIAKKAQTQPKPKRKVNAGTVHRLFKARFPKSRITDTEKMRKKLGL